MFVDLTDKKVVVAGAGTIAKRRIRALAEFTDRLVVVAPEVNQELKEMEARGKLTILKKHCEREDLYDAALVIAATNDNKINQEIYSVCKCLGIPVNVCADKTKCDFYFPVNVCADKTKCDFYFPGIVTDENFVVGISTSGREHKKAREVTDKIQALLAQEE